MLHNKESSYNDFESNQRKNIGDYVIKNIKSIEKINECMNVSNYPFLTKVPSITQRALMFNTIYCFSS